MPIPSSVSMEPVRMANIAPAYNVLENAKGESIAMVDDSI